jgi:hypothetical protein
MHGEVEVAPVEVWLEAAARGSVDIGRHRLSLGRLGSLASLAARAVGVVTVVPL